ncbi:MAG: glycosyltransferase family 4 protein [Firmicutes bacterium]|jgi:glycogen(starch) synthase|nr:glycosyltransferase family 4 protein [Bacillota bacterium]
MKILILSWEFPPRVVGGIAAHVYDLSLALVKEGQEVHVLTAGLPGVPEEEEIGGIMVHRVANNNPEAFDFISGVLQLNLNLVEKAVSLGREGNGFQIIHSHDWVTAYAGKLLKHAWRLPLVATVHATEWGRNNGLHTPLQRYISDVEWWLTYEGWKVICCSRYMWDELQRIFQLPPDKLRVIPNGVYPERFRRLAGDPAAVRGRFAAPDEKIVFFVGRLVREKGLDHLLEAAARVLARFPRVKFVIAGKGPYESRLKESARNLGIYHKVYFCGYLDDETRNALFRLADVAVFPSLYEPFGIVALEAMAAGTPVVVSDTGGLGEVVRHGENGLKAAPGDTSSLAANILRLLNHPEEGEVLRNLAAREVEEVYNWGKIARQTLEVYEEVWQEYLASPWKPVDKDEMYSRDPRDFPAPGGDREREHAHEPVFHRYLQVEN